MRSTSEMDVNFMKRRRIVFDGSLLMTPVNVEYQITCHRLGWNGFNLKLRCTANYYVSA